MILATLALIATLAWPAYVAYLSTRRINAIKDDKEVARIRGGLIDPEPDPEPWPVRQTPTDLAAAYEPVTVDRHVEWDTDAFEQLHQEFLRGQEHYEWARERVDEYIVDARDWLVSA